MGNDIICHMSCVCRKHGFFKINRGESYITSNAHGAAWRGAAAVTPGRDCPRRLSVTRSFTIDHFSSYRIAGDFLSVTITAF